MSIDPKILAKLQAQTEIPLPSRDGDLAAVQRCLPCSLEGTPKQVSWAEGIRMQALLLKWQDAVLSKLARIKDATWWIANKGILDTCKFKEPLPQQMTGCSLILPVSEEAKEGSRSLRVQVRLPISSKTFALIN